MIRLSDIKYAARSLSRAPAFALTAMLSLAIGIGGTAAIFSLADALFFRPARGIPAPDRLVEVGRVFHNQRFGNLSYPNYADFRDRNRVFAELAAYRPVSEPFGLSTGDTAARVDGTSVSGNYFRMLGVGMALGRDFAPDEDDVAAPRAVTVISYRLWQRRFNSDPDAIGQSIRLNDRPFTIVGVARAGFAGHNVATTDLWIPMAARIIAFGSAGGQDATAAAFSVRAGVWLLAMGRLKPGVTVAQAQDDMSRIARELVREYPEANRDAGVAVARARAVPAQIAPMAAAFIGLLFVLVAIVLFIACANVAAVMLTRALTRGREVGVRLALGASRSRIMVLLLVESVMLGAGGSVAGVAVAYALVNALRAAVPVLPISVAVDVRVDWRVVLFSVIVSLAVGMLSGVLPARQSAQTDLTTSMKTEGDGRLPRRRLQHAFVVGQVAASVLLLVVALLLGRSLLHADRIDPGFDIQHLEAAALDLRLGGYDDARGDQFLDRLLQGVTRVRGVQGAAIAQIVPLSTESMQLGMLRRPGAAPDPQHAVFPSWDAVSPEYFSTMRILLLGGRAFADRDGRDAERVVIINQTLARRLWPGEDAVGQQVVYREGLPGEDRLLRVVGVARDAKYSTLGEVAEPHVYVPFTQRSKFVPHIASLLVRVDRGSALSAVIALVREIDPNLPVVRSGRLTDLSAFSLIPHRAATWLAGAVGLVGLLLASIGLYGITAFNVQRRTREIGIRIAVGARAADVMRMVTSRGVLLAAVGGGIGVLLAAGAARVLTVFLYDVGPLDPWSFGIGMLLLALTALVASLIPASRAARVDPVIALRSE